MLASTQGKITRDQTCHRCPNFKINVYHAKFISEEKENQNLKHKATPTAKELAGEFSAWADPSNVCSFTIHDRMN